MPLNSFGIVVAANVRVREFAPDSAVYRCGQPDAAGFHDLRALGVQTLIKLDRDDEFPDALETQLAGGATVIPYAVSAWHPDRLTVEAIARKVEQARVLGAVAIHCRRGRDRTGLVVGAYRLLVAGWSLEDTLAEFRSYGVSGLVALADHEIVECLRAIAAGRPS